MIVLKRIIKVLRIPMKIALLEEQFRGLIILFLHIHNKIVLIYFIQREHFPSLYRLRDMNVNFYEVIIYVKVV